MEDTISSYRKKIDALDFQLLDILSQRRDSYQEMRDILEQRIHLVREIALYKQEHGLPPLDAEREQEMFASRCAYGIELGLSLEEVTALFQNILVESHRIFEKQYKSVAHP